MENRNFINEVIDYKKVMVISSAVLLGAMLSLFLLPVAAGFKVILFVISFIGGFMIEFSLKNRKKQLTYQDLLLSIENEIKFMFKGIGYVIRKIDRYLSIKSLILFSLVIYFTIFQIIPFIIRQSGLGNKILVDTITYSEVSINLQAIVLGLGPTFLLGLILLIGYCFVRFIGLHQQGKAIKELFKQIEQQKIEIPYFHRQGKCLCDSDRLLDKLFELGKHDDSIKALYLELKDNADYFKELTFEIK